MCQQKIYNILKENPNRWYTTKELNDELDITTATANVLRLYKFHEIKRRKVKINNHYGYEYKFK